MEEKFVYSARERIPGQNNFIRINEAVSVVLKRLGWSAVNVSYILSEGLPVKAYGYYKLPKIGRIRTALIYKDSQYTFFVNLLGFEGKSQEYYKTLVYMENVLKRVLH